MKPGDYLKDTAIDQPHHGPKSWVRIVRVIDDKAYGYQFYNNTRQLDFTPKMWIHNFHSWKLTDEFSGVVTKTERGEDDE